MRREARRFFKKHGQGVAYVVVLVVGLGAFLWGIGSCAPASDEDLEGNRGRAPAVIIVE